MKVEQTIPMLRIFDVAKAREFYVDFLGFTIDWEAHIFEGSPLYMQVSRDGLTLHLTEHHGDCCPGGAVFLWMSGIEEYHREIQSKNYKGNNPGLENAPWKARLMRVTDPFGNKILFNEKLPDESS